MYFCAFSCPIKYFGAVVQNARNWAPSNIYRMSMCGAHNTLTANTTSLARKPSTAARAVLIDVHCLYPASSHSTPFCSPWLSWCGCQTVRIKPCDETFLNTMFLSFRVPLWCLKISFGVSFFFFFAPAVDNDNWCPVECDSCWDAVLVLTWEKNTVFLSLPLVEHQAFPGSEARPDPHHCSQTGLNVPLVYLLLCCISYHCVVNLHQEAI